MHYPDLSMHHRASKRENPGKPLSVGMRSLAILLCLQLALPASLLAEVVVDKNADKGKQAQIDHAANGVELVNIAEANERGVSHNKYEKFNVDSSGLILNNGAEVHQSQLGGYIAGNKNLQQSGSASLILNEVTRANRSSLGGAIEISGQAAELVIANPYGITCAGCGFINTPRATLTTGVPRLSDGNLTGFDIRSGDVSFTGTGLDASALGNLDIWARRIALSAPLLASDLSLIAGINRVDYASRQVSLLSATGDEPELAIDASALGAIQANRIFMLATEDGVGVRSRADMSSLGDFTLTADGRVELNSVAAGGSAKVKAGSELAVGQQLYGRSVSLSADKIGNKGLIAAESGLVLSGGQLQNDGDLIAGLDGRGEQVAGGTIEADLTRDLNNAGLIGAARVRLHSGTEIVNSGGLIQAGNALQLGAPALDNNGGEIYALSGPLAELDFDRLNNRNGIIQSQSNQLAIAPGSWLDNSGGKLQQFGSNDLLLDFNNISNDHGQIQAEGALQLDAQQLTNRSGVITALGGDSTDLILGALDNSQGIIQSQSEQLRITTDADLLNSGGVIKQLGSGSLTLQSGAALHSDGGEVTAVHSLEIRAQDFSQADGLVSADDVDIQLTGALDNQQGSIDADSLSITANALDNRGGTLRAVSDADNALQLNLSSLDNRNGGLLETASRNWSLSLDSLDNSGGEVRHGGTGTFELTVLDQLMNAGKLLSNGSVSIDSGSFVNSADLSLGGQLIAAANLNIVSGKLENLGGLIEAGEAADFTVAELDNRQGSIRALGPEDFNLRVAGRLDNGGGTIASAANTMFVRAGGELVNGSGSVLHSGSGVLSLSGTSLDNSEGEIASNGALAMEALAGGIDNTSGNISSIESLSLRAGGTLNNVAGRLEAGGDLSLDSAGLDNRGGSVTGTGNNFDLVSRGDIDNSGNGRIATAAENATVEAAGSINNAGGSISHAGNGKLSLVAQLLDNSGDGLVGSNGSLGIASDSALNNRSGTLLAVGGLSVSANGLDNRGGYIEQGSGILELLLGAGSLANGSGGKIFAENAKVTASALEGAGGLLQGQQTVELNLDSAALDRLGDIRAGQLITVDSKGDITQAAEKRFATDANLVLKATGDLDNRGTIASKAKLSIDVKRINNRAGAEMTGSELDLTGTVFSNRGHIGAVNQAKLTGTSLNNTDGGSIAAGGSLTLFLSNLIGNDALIFAAGNMNLYADRLKNNGGDIYAIGNIRIAKNSSGAKSTSVENISGLIESRDGDLVIASENILNRRSDVQIAQDKNLSALDFAQDANDVFLFDQALLSWQVPGWGDASRRRWVAYWIDLHIARLNQLPGGIIDTATVDDIKWVLGEEAANAGDNLELATVSNILKREIELLEKWLPAKVSASRTALEAQLAGVKPGFQVIDFRVDPTWDWNNDRDRIVRVVRDYTAANTYREYLASAGADARMLAGGDIAMSGGDIRNEYGTISAANNIRITGDKLENVGRDLQFSQGNSTTTYQFHNGDYQAGEDRHESAIYTEVIGYVPANIHAGGSVVVDVRDKIDNSSIRSGQNYSSGTGRTADTSTSGKRLANYDALGGAQTAETGQLGADGPGSASGIIAIGARTDSNGQLIAEAGKAALDPLAVHGFELPDGGLFVRNLKAGSPYLVETNPALTGYTNFIGSEYFLDQLELDAEALPKRLGDAFYENQILRDSIFQATGQRFLHPGLASDYDQYKWLMDNALAAVEDLDLSVGVALSNEQIALLQTDIVWLVETQVAGQTVLVPVIYLADIENRQLRENGALISGGSVQLTTGDLHNSGGLRSEGRLALFSEGSILNEDGDLVAGGELLARAGGDIENLSGRIRGDSVLLNAGGSVVSETLTRVLGYNSDARGTRLESSNTAVGNIASISATGGKLVMQAGEDMRLIASRLDAANDAQLVAGNDLVLDSKAIDNRSAAWGSHAHSVVESTEHLASSVDAGGSVSLASGADTRLTGAEVNASGDIALQAGGHITLESVSDSESSDYYSEKKGSGFLAKDTTVTEQHHAEQVVGSSLNASGGQVFVAADGDVSILGSSIDADKDIAISGDDITVAASSREESHYSARTEEGGFSNESYGEASYQLQLAAAELSSASGSIALDAAKNITIAASNLVADSGDINLTAVDDILVAAGEVIESSSTWSEDSGYFSGGDFYASEQQAVSTEQTLAQGSLISAGNDINIDAGRAKVVGSDLAAGNDIVAETDIGDIEILAARETTHTTYDEKQVRVSAGDAAQSLANPDELVKVEDGQLKIKLADAEYHSLDSESTEVSHKGSNLSAGNNIELNAIGDLTIEGSNLAADADASGAGDIALSGENVTIKEAKDSLQTKTSETSGSAEMSVVVQHQAVEVAKAAVALEESTENLKQAKEDYRKYQKDLDNLEDTLDQLEADYANGEPGVTQADIVELKQLIDDAESDEAWYLAGLATAAADVTSKTTLLVQQSAAAAQSTATYGFNAGVQLDIDASKTDTESYQTNSLASNLSGSNIRIETGSGNEEETTGNTLIQGSHLQADNSIAIDTGDLTVQASVDTAQSSTENQHGHISVQQTVYGATGGPAVNASMDRSKSRDRQTTYNNSSLNAGEIDLNSSGDTTIAGANIHAGDKLQVAVGGDLTVESQQNRASGSNTSAGISGGFGTSGGDNSSLSSVNGGANSANGRYQNKETVLTSLTSGGEATIDVGGHTQVTGAVIATVDEEGKDLGNLELTTGTIDYADLSNTDYSSQQSAGLSTSVGLNGANPADPAQQNAADASGNDDLRLNTSNVQYSNESHYSKGKTLATVGQGSITVRDEENSADLDRLNRDVAGTDKELFEVEWQEGNVDVTVDHRLLSEEGRKEIKEDVKRTELLGKTILDVATRKDVSLQDTFQHIGDIQKDLDVQKLLATRDGGENASILNDLANATPEQKQQAIDAYAQAYADVYDINIDEAKVVAANAFIGGAHVSEDGTSSDIYINDNAQDNALDYMETVGHEVTHSQIEQRKTRDRGNELNEDYADLRGEYAADNYEFNFANNGLGTVDTGLTNNHVGNTSSKLVAQNTEQFVSRVESNPGNIEYRPLERQETEALGAVVDQIQRAPYNQEIKEQLIANATAEACAKTHCAEGVPESDPSYQALKNLQAAGKTLIEEGQNLLSDTGEGQFEYDWVDGAQDTLRANAEPIARVQGATQAVLGGVATVSSGAATAATVPVCATTGAGCVATAGTAALTALSATAAIDGYQQATGEYQSSFGQEVLDNLLPETYQDPSNPAADIAIGVGVDVALGAAGKVAGKVVDAAEDLAKSAKKNSKNTDGAPERGGISGGDAPGELIPPGMDRPFRSANPDFPPDPTLVEAMNSPQIQNMVECTGADCSEIAAKLFDASGGKGAVIEVKPIEPGNLNVFENGFKDTEQFYHEVYTDGRYVYDPRLSPDPIPKGDWEKHIKGINPDGVTISEILKGSE